jgi:hypothetical protein
MRLSEAILLGSTVVTPKAGALKFSGENAGCALGMAVVASGGTFHRVKGKIAETERRTLNIESLYGTWLLRIVSRPCDCRAPLTLNRPRFEEIRAYLSHPRSPALPPALRVKDIVGHLFDYHVMKKNDWTLDRLATWLRPLEPAEPAEPSFRHRDVPTSSSVAEAEAWRKTREAFEARVKAKGSRSVQRTGH